MKIAIGTTIRDSEAYLYTFIKYHLSIGFDIIYLFLDDSDEVNMLTDICDERVVIVKRDAELELKWKKTRMYTHLASHIETEVMARQILNINVALELASEMNISWILNIDVDELFYSPEETVKEHFARITRSGIDVISYANHEAIPEKIESSNVFKDVTLFKKNPRFLTKTQNKILRDNIDKNMCYFHFYQNGKSAAKVSKKLVSTSCHAFVHESYWKRALSTVSQRYILSKISDPCVLHFCCCSFDLFFKKYKILGKFNDSWFNAKTEIKTILPTHINSRDICIDKNIATARTYYRNVFIDAPTRNVSHLLENKIYFRLFLDV